MTGEVRGLKTKSLTTERTGEQQGENWLCLYNWLSRTMTIGSQ
jgi:hypothetical protein